MLLVTSQQMQEGGGQLWRTGLEQNSKDIGNRYMSSAIRGENRKPVT